MFLITLLLPVYYRMTVPAEFHMDVRTSSKLQFSIGQLWQQLMQVTNLSSCTDQGCITNQTVVQQISIMWYKSLDTDLKKKPSIGL